MFEESWRGVLIFFFVGGFNCDFILSLNDLPYIFFVQRGLCLYRYIDYFSSLCDIMEMHVNTCPVLSKKFTIQSLSYS